MEAEQEAEQSGGETQRDEKHRGTWAYQAIGDPGSE